MSQPTKKLLGNRVLLRPFAKESKIGEHIIIPEVAKEYTHKAEVIGIGVGKPDDQIQEEVGDVVLYSKDRVFPFSLDGQDYFIVFQDAIHCVL